MRATFAEAGGKIPPSGGGGTGWFDGFRRALGGLVGKPSETSYYKFNFINESFTTPMGLGARDARFGRLQNAIMGTNRRAAALKNSWKQLMPSWETASQADREAVYRALEIMTLKNEPAVLDGRTILTENDGSTPGLRQAWYSKTGDIARLANPKHIQMFTEHVQAMQQVKKDYVAGVAAQKVPKGWTGDLNAAGIYKAAAEATGSEKRELERAAGLVAAIEYASRNPYVPLRREGNYFFRVTPKRPPREFTPEGKSLPMTPEAEEMAKRWTGEGKPLTERFELIDAFSPMERFIGGTQRGVPPNVEAKLAELRQKFPETDYAIEHGFAFRDEDAIRDLPIPILDKLMNLASNDAKKELAQGFKQAAASKGIDLSAEEARRQAAAAYDRVEKEILGKVFEANKAGFRRPREGIAGYSPEFGVSTEKYFQQLSHYVSDMEFRPQFDAALQAVQAHPDGRVVKYAQDHLTYLENTGQRDNQLYGPLARLRQASFMALLGANVSTSVKIATHGILRGAPILGTGMGAQGRALVLGSYMKTQAEMLAKGLRPGRNGIELDPSVAAHNEGERSLLASAEAEEIMHPQAIEETSALRRGGPEEQVLSDRARFLRRVGTIWSSNVTSMDRLGRGTMLLSAYRLAQRVGIPEINRAWGADMNWASVPDKSPETFAKFMVDQTMGVYGRTNRMPAARSQLGAMVMQYKPYELGYLQNMYQMLTRMGPEGRATAALMLGGISLVGGAIAWPFAKDGAEAASAVWGLITGLAPDLPSELEALADMIGGPGTGDILVHGPARAVSGIDLSSLGFGDLVSRNMQSPLDYFGAAVSSFGGSAQRAYQRYHSGQEPLSIVRELLPNAIKGPLGALYPETALSSAATGTPIRSADQLSTAEKVEMGLNFRPAATSKAYETRTRDLQLHAHYEHAISQAESKIANLMHRGDTDGASAAMSQARQLVAEAQRKAGFSSAEIATFNRQLRQAIMRREHPEVPSKTQQRIEAGRAPNS